MRLSALALALTSTIGIAAAQTMPSAELKVSALEVQPARRTLPSPSDLAQLRQATRDSPKLRDPHFALTRALMASGDLASAHEEAASWRVHDAYNLVVVRLLGDIETEQGDSARARRTYSSIVELLPRDVQARRALATVLKQAGDLQGARQQLLAALEIADDRHTTFELGDVEYRLGLPEARGRFQAIADAADAPEAVRYPARQRLAQIAARARRDAAARGDGAKVAELDTATVGKWRDIARDTAWKDYGAKTAVSAKLLKLASDVSA